MTDWTELNRRGWNERAAPHAASADYGFDKFVSDASYISDVVRFDLPSLGDIRGLRGVHLQCHIGTDTVSLQRLGATMIGLDFAAEALDQARRLALAAGADIDFVRCELYEALTVLPETSFDLVYTGIGALCWLPDITRWAQIVAKLLRPGGRLFIREGHPMLWAMADPRADGLLVVEHAYRERAEPEIFDEPGTYVETDHQFTNTVSAVWNHGLGEIVSSLLDAGLQLRMLLEHDSVPWNALPGMMSKIGNGEYRLTDRPWRLPHTYTLQAVKP